MLLEIDAQNALYYIHHPPADDRPTFVFVNALTGSTPAWETAVAPALRAEGYGTLSWNFRGQAESRFGPDVAITAELIAEDLGRLLAEVAPARPVLVGVSIGGLYAARAVLAGAQVEGLVLLNTLREIGPRIGWINDAMPQLVAEGGFELILDVLLPLLVNAEFAEKARAGALKGGYAPLDPEHGHMNLMRHAPDTDWEIPYEQLDLPVLVITGLQDRVFLDREVVDRLYARLPNAQRQDWEDTGHLIPQERPEKLAAALAAFGAAL
ncbi:alpha/beta fold hydrolase [Pontivivens ytuae]|uniref:Alpha/beta fold hydrolase n=1 Tax=Pontivivens ytuae TaxID=2789856 RepID=A0A7S9QCP7_9RHOB|nr:alpha/beta hydrolase [Pontivivens ytuae]QPH54453.1 alpha/beta fold hydrolase [Pontivivens ytuae]